MVKKQEYPRRNNNQGQRSYQEQANRRDGQEQGARREASDQNNRREGGEQGNRREGQPPRNNYRDRDNSYRQNYSGPGSAANASGGNTNHNSSSRYSNRVRAVETIDDIKADISRLEKEIELEIKEIKSLRLGL